MHRQKITARQQPKPPQQTRKSSVSHPPISVTDTAISVTDDSISVTDAVISATHDSISVTDATVSVTGGSISVTDDSGNVGGDSISVGGATNRANSTGLCGFLGGVGFCRCV